MHKQDLFILNELATSHFILFPPSPSPSTQAMEEKHIVLKPKVNLERIKLLKLILLTKKWISMMLR